MRDESQRRIWYLAKSGNVIVIAWIFLASSGVGYSLAQQGSFDGVFAIILAAAFGAMAILVYASLMHAAHELYLWTRRNSSKGGNRE